MGRGRGEFRRGIRGNGGGNIWEVVVGWRRMRLRLCGLTGRAAGPRPFGDPIFRCTTKDRGERRAASSQAPYHLWQLCAASAFISLLLLPPPNPLRWALAGTPAAAPVGSPGVMLTGFDESVPDVFPPRGLPSGRALVPRPNFNQGWCSAYPHPFVPTAP